MKTMKKIFWTTSLVLLVFAAAPANADFVINDDLIVDGSACIGFDCVNGESFGFDTIRLKENNLRIKFDDTSVASSFPRNDWQLTANASANGGASKFSIDDISGSRTPFTVEANARSHSLYVDDGGRIGNRTSTPSTEIHTIDGDTPTLRLQQDGSSGFAPQTWDVAGNETNFFIRDVTNGSTLPFRIRPGADTSAIFVDTNSDVGFNTASPDTSVHVLRTDGSAGVLVEDTNTGTTAQEMFRLVSAGDKNVDMFIENADAEWRFRNNSQGQLFINELGGMDNAIEIRSATAATTAAGDTVTIGGAVGATAFNVLPSQRKFKTDIVPVDAQSVLQKLVELEIAHWRYKNEVTDSEELHLSPMAEDFKAAFGLTGDGRSLSLADMSGVALAAIQALAERNQELVQQNEQLAAEMDELKALVREALEAR